jgi:hypothetical protein
MAQRGEIDPSQVYSGTSKQKRREDIAQAFQHEVSLGTSWASYGSFSVSSAHLFTPFSLQDLCSSTLSPFVSSRPSAQMAAHASKYGVTRA